MIVSGNRIEIEIAVGTLAVVTNNDPEYLGLTIYWNGRQIAVVEGTESKLYPVRVLTWATDTEDYDNEIRIRSGFGE